MPPAELGGTRRVATLALLSFAMLLVSLDQYIVVVALPDIGRELGYSSQTLQAVISAYAIASSGFLLLGGRATDLLGRRRMLATGLALYAVASLAGGLATGPEVLLAARAAQGLGGALVFPGTLALINTTFAEGHERNRALGIWGGAGAAGLVIGVLLGGILTRAFGWEAVFFVNVPLAGAALVLTFQLIDADRARDTSRLFDLARRADGHRRRQPAGARARAGPQLRLELTGNPHCHRGRVGAARELHHHRAAQPRSARATPSACQGCPRPGRRDRIHVHGDLRLPALLPLHLLSGRAGLRRAGDRYRLPASHRRGRRRSTLAGPGRDALRPQTHARHRAHARRHWRRRARPGAIRRMALTPRSSPALSLSASAMVSCSRPCSSPRPPA